MEPYHRQPPADKADSKLKTAKKNGPHPSHYFNRTVPITTEPQRRKKPVQPRHPPQANTQINSTGPTLHTAEPHAEGKYDPARQKNSQGPSTPKINRTRDECNKWINTYETPPTNKSKKKENPTRRKTTFKKKKRKSTIILQQLKKNPILAEDYTSHQDIEQTFTNKRKVILPRHDRIKTNSED